jgi:hypothetical protein
LYLVTIVRFMAAWENMFRFFIFLVTTKRTTFIVMDGAKKHGEILQSI